LIRKITEDWENEWSEFDRIEKGRLAKVAWTEGQDNGKEDGKDHMTEDHRGGYKKRESK